MAEAVFRHPDRYSALAALLIHNSDVASEELTRSVMEMGFKGALVNGFQQSGQEDSAVYLDEPMLRPLGDGLGFGRAVLFTSLHAATVPIAGLLRLPLAEESALEVCDRDL